MVKITAFLIIGLLSLNLDERGTKLLENIQEKFDKINNLSAEFKQTTNGKALLTGTLLLKKDDKLRIEFKHSILVSDGKTNWSYNKKENKVIISNNKESNASPLSLKKIIYDYPKEFAALAQLNDDGKTAQRFEFYIAGIELGDCYTELTDWQKQKERFLKEDNQRKKLKKIDHPIDKDFIEALKYGLPSCAGIAIGVERLAMIFANLNSIEKLKLVQIG